jgi:hypothetical protein
MVDETAEGDGAALAAAPATSSEAGPRNEEISPIKSVSSAITATKRNYAVVPTGVLLCRKQSMQAASGNAQRNQAKDLGKRGEKGERKDTSCQLVSQQQKKNHK